MAEGNGGELKPGERLSRIENDIKDINSHLGEIRVHLDERITRHRERNEQHIRDLQRSVLKGLDERVTTLERHDVAEDAVRSYRKWLIGIGVVVILGLLGNVIAVLQLMQRVHP